MAQVIYDDSDTVIIKYESATTKKLHFEIEQNEQTVDFDLDELIDIMQVLVIHSLGKILGGEKGPMDNIGKREGTRRTVTYDGKTVLMDNIQTACGESKTEEHKPIKLYESMKDGTEFYGWDIGAGFIAAKSPEDILTIKFEPYYY